MESRWVCCGYRHRCAIPIFYILVIQLIGFEGERKLILLTSTFDVLSEAPLYVEEFGEGKSYFFVSMLFPQPNLLRHYQIPQSTLDGVLSKPNSTDLWENLLRRQHRKLN